MGVVDPRLQNPIFDTKGADCALGQGLCLQASLYGESVPILPSHRGTSNMYSFAGKLNGDPNLQQAFDPASLGRNKRPYRTATGCCWHTLTGEAHTPVRWKLVRELGNSDIHATQWINRYAGLNRPVRLERQTETRPPLVPGRLPTLPRSRQLANSRRCSPTNPEGQRLATTPRHALPIGGVVHLGDHRSEVEGMSDFGARSLDRRRWREDLKHARLPALARSKDGAVGRAVISRSGKGAAWDGKVAFITGAARGQAGRDAVRLAEEAGHHRCRHLPLAAHGSLRGGDTRRPEGTAKLVEDLDRRIAAGRPTSATSGSCRQRSRRDSPNGLFDVVCCNAGIASYAPTLEWTSRCGRK